MFRHPNNAYTQLFLKGPFMNETVRVTAERIRKLEVQGARNVAIAAIKALESLAEQTKTNTRNHRDLNSIRKGYLILKPQVQRSDKKWIGE